VNSFSISTRFDHEQMYFEFPDYPMKHSSGLMDWDVTEEYMRARDNEMLLYVYVDRLFGLDSNIVTAILKIFLCRNGSSPNPRHRKLIVASCRVSAGAISTSPSIAQTTCAGSGLSAPSHFSLWQRRCLHLWLRAGTQVSPCQALNKWAQHTHRDLRTRNPRMRRMV
jgi:hypothetical protein